MKWTPIKSQLYWNKDTGDDLTAAGDDGSPNETLQLWLLFPDALSRRFRFPVNILFAFLRPSHILVLSCHFRT
jgi:hypothetical protein